MRTLAIILVLALSAPSMAWAELHYTIRVDGLACPFCAFGIEKQFRKMDGVEKVRTDLEKGHVHVLTQDDVEFTDKQLTRLFESSGFTYRSMEVHSRESGQDPDQESGKE